MGKPRSKGDGKRGKGKGSGGGKSADKSNQADMDMDWRGGSSSAGGGGDARYSEAEWRGDGGYAREDGSAKWGNNGRRDRSGANAYGDGGDGSNSYNSGAGASGGGRRRKGGGKDDGRFSRGGDHSARDEQTAPSRAQRHEDDDPPLRDPPTEKESPREESPMPKQTFTSHDVRYETQVQGGDADLGCQDVRYECQDVRYMDEPSGQQNKSGRAKPKSEGGGRNRRGGGGGGGGGGGTGAVGEGGGDHQPKDKSSRSRGGKRGGGGGGGGGGASADGGCENSKERSATHALSSKVRKLIASYDESLDVNELKEAYDCVEAAVAAGESFVDSETTKLLLISLTKISQLSKAHKIVDAAVAHKVHLDVTGIVAIAGAVSQRSKSYLALRYLRRLIYECLPELPQEETAFFDRHISFIFSELMAEADGCFGRIDNRDPNTLVNLGHTELDIRMDWQKSTSSNFLLFNRIDDKNRQLYVPTVFQGGFTRTDFALMSFDMSHPEVAAKAPRDYDKIRDGAEVEVKEGGVANNPTALMVKLCSPARVQFVPEMAYRLDRLASRDQTRRMLDALRTVLKKPEDKDGQSSLQPAACLRELILVPITDTLAKVGKMDIPLQLMSWESCKARNAALKSFQEAGSLECYTASLNKSQVEALTRACTQRVCLIQGPPGTGKTTTAVQIVSALVQYGLVELPMLVTADSNTAVDNLVKGLGKRGLNVVRVGRPESIREDVKQYALDGRWKELKKAEVVCATCIGASGATLDKVRFSTVLIDECTQAAESAALVPLARGCQQAILIGDQCQLPPTVLSDLAENENLGESLFTRLVTQGVRPVLLDTQYRMHPLISEFASAAFYNGRLQNGVAHFDRKPPEGFPWPQRQMPVAFVNLEKGEEKREGSSYVNPTEAEKTLWALQEVCKNDILGPDDVGLVTPYKGQVNLIKKIIRERPGLQKFRSGLEVESVDGFQGQEKEVIIFCAVRNNREGKVGFLSDWRRLNVMLTRARRGCIVIGSRSTLVSDPLWAEWLKWAAYRGAICGESAKGKWEPRYLVDDRDGVWTVKASIIAEAEGRPPGPGGAQPSTQKDSAASLVPKKEEPEPVLDSWEDMDDDTPEQKPAEASLEREVSPMEDLAPTGDGADGASKELTRAEERRLAMLEEEPEENTSRIQSSAGATTSQGTSSPAPVQRQTSGGRRVSIEEPQGSGDEVRCSGTPNMGPKSPSRQLALAKLGLLDDLDLEESK